MEKPFYLLVLFGGILTVISYPMNNEEDNRVPRSLRNRYNTIQASEALLRKRKHLAKRDAWYPQNQAFNSYLNAFALNVMAQAYGLNNNFLNGFNGGYFYPYSNPNPYLNMYPPVMMPSYAQQMALKRSFIPPIPSQVNYFHHQPPFKNIIPSPIDPRDYGLPGLKYPFMTSQHHPDAADIAKNIYVNNLLHTPLRVLAKKHGISMKRKNRSQADEVNNDMNSLIKDIGEFNETAYGAQHTSKKGAKVFDEAVNDIREASLSTNTDGTSVFRYVVRSVPNVTEIVSRSEVGKPSPRNPVGSLIKALKSKIKFEKDLIKSFVNYICDKNCSND